VGENPKRHLAGKSRRFDTVKERGHFRALRRAVSNPSAEGIKFRCRMAVGASIPRNKQQVLHRSHPYNISYNLS